MESEINYMGKKYILFKNKDGKKSLKRYNEKFKMWMILDFAQEDQGIRELILNELSEEYLNQRTSSL